MGHITRFYKLMAKGNIKQKVEKKQKKFTNLFENTKKIFKIGTHVQPKRDLTRFVKWPQYILLQRQKRILFKRLKVPGMINQFTHTLPVDKVKALFKILGKYKPETPAEKKARLLQSAKNEVSGKKDAATKPKFIKSGLNHVTTLVEQGKAKMVIIAHDVDPIELVVWLPNLCVSKNIPYCFVKSKSRLGQLINKKKTSCLAVTDIRKEDAGEFEKLCQNFLVNYNQNADMRHKTGEIVFGHKANIRIQKQEKAKEAELLQKA